jgi:hypothetical protein
VSCVFCDVTVSHDVAHPPDAAEQQRRDRDPRRLPQPIRHGPALTAGADQERQPDHCHDGKVHSELGQEAHTGQHPKDCRMNIPAAVAHVDHRSQRRQPDDQLGQAVVFDARHHGDVLRQERDKSGSRQRQPGLRREAHLHDGPRHHHNARAEQYGKQSQCRQVASAHGVERGSQQVKQRRLVILVLDRVQPSLQRSRAELRGFDRFEVSVIPVAPLQFGTAAVGGNLGDIIVVSRFVRNLPRWRLDSVQGGDHQVGQCDQRHCHKLDTTSQVSYSSRLWPCQPRRRT